MIELITAIIEFMKEHSVEMLAVWGAILTIATVVVKITPSKTDDKVLDVIIKVLNALALNPLKDKEKQKKDLEDEMNERDNDRTRSNLTDVLR